jgi:hypothetical protein
VVDVWEQGGGAEVFFGEKGGAKPRLFLRSQPHLAHTKSRRISRTAKFHSSAKITPIENALADLKNQKYFNYSKTVFLFGIDRSTLSRRYRGVS